ncbi:MULTISPECIES: DcrB-related protein [unclassified Pasteurella]|uniref:DcrB-related protein n=1 Tax=unclassified Pasteurella TaxID=2621516 RepID=UPI0010740DBF|nr:DUF1795 domain-containing protein [Pasteurella sp. 19428wF3_WM03]TFU50982.1 DUF1795 domain-containing protein [Pasteurella sp. WM03]
MNSNTYRLNEGLINIPVNWQDQSMNVFTLPDDSGINLVINRATIPIGMTEEEYLAQVISQFRTTLKAYRELAIEDIRLSEHPAKLLEYQWDTPEGQMYQLTVLQVYQQRLMTFTYTSTTVFTPSQRQALLEIIYSFSLT